MKFKNFEYLFGSLLVIVFIVLKLTEVIDWSWWWLLVPILLYF